MSQHLEDGAQECVEEVTAYPQGCVVEFEVGGHTFRLRADVARGLMIDIGWSLGELLSEETVVPIDPRRRASEKARRLARTIHNPKGETT